VATPCRLAVDFSIPLITNIKCAKLFIEALSRLDTLPVRPHDFRVRRRRRRRRRFDRPHSYPF